MTLSACTGCGLLVATRTGLCSECQRRKDKDAACNATRPPHHAVYRSSRWRKLAAEVTAGATRCHHCLRPTKKLLADHIVPIDQHPSGAYDRGNLVPACYACNRRRGLNAKLPDLEPATTHGAAGVALLSPAALIHGRSRTHAAGTALVAGRMPPRSPVDHPDPDEVTS